MTCRKLLFSSPLACGGNHTRCALAITHHHTGSAISEQVARNIRPGAFSNKRLLLQICVKKCVWWSAEQIFDQMARKQPCLVVAPNRRKNVHLGNGAVKTTGESQTESDLAVDTKGCDAIQNNAPGVKFEVFAAARLCLPLFFNPNRKVPPMPFVSCVRRGTTQSNCESRDTLLLLVMVVVYCFICSCCCCYCCVCQTAWLYGTCETRERERERMQ